MLWCPLRFPHAKDVRSLPQVVCRRVHILFTLFVLACALWCPTHIVLCFSSYCISCVVSFSGVFILGLPFRYFLKFIKYYSNYMLGQKSEQEVLNTVIIMFLQHLHKHRPVLQWRMCIHAPNKLFDVCRRVKTVTTWQTLETEIVQFVVAYHVGIA